MSHDQPQIRVDERASDLRQCSENIEQHPPATQAKGVVPALQVDQIELEMQNKELRRVQQEFEAARDKYFDLYDGAPVGYLTLSDQGLIQGANLTLAALLGVEHESLVNLPLTRFIVPEDQDIFYQQRRWLDETGVPHICELRMVRRNDAPFWANIKTVLKPDAAGGPPSYWATVNDISERKQAQEALGRSERLMHATVDALSAHIAILDETGSIVAVNRTWYEFAQANGPLPSTACEGANYLTVCDAARGPDAVQAAAAAAGIRAVMHGEQAEFSLEYPCDSPDEERWFQARVTRFAGEDPVRIVVAHENVTDRKRQAKALAASETRFHAMFTNHATVMLLVEPASGAIVDANLAAEKFYGYPISHLCTLNIINLNTLPPDQVVLERQRALKEDRNYFIFPHRLANGEIRTVEVHSSPIALGNKSVLFSVIHDITAQQQAEVALRKSEAHSSAVTHSASDAIVSADNAGNIIGWNRGAATIFGYSEAETSGQPLTMLMSSSLHNGHLASFARLHAGGEPHIIGKTVELVGQRKDGSEFAMELSLADWQADEGRYYTAIIRDITERRALEMEILQLNASLEQQVLERTAQLAAAVADLKRASRMKDGFMAAVSHELRTPLAGVLGMAEALEMPLSGPLSERQARYVQSIRQSGERLLSMINSILRYTDLMAGNVKIQQEPCRLAEFCAIGVRAVRGRAEQKGQTVVFSVDPVELAIISDADGITLMLQQLLNNAVKFTPIGGRIGLEVYRDPEEAAVHLVVWDTGIGIAAEQQMYIFQPFIQGDSSLARHFEGVGLGLAYVQRMIELLGGTITVESMLGEGSRFTVTLPVHNVTTDRI